MLSAALASESEGRRSRKLGVDFYEIVAGSALFLLFLYFFDVVEMFIEPSSALNRFFVLSAGAIGVMIIAAKLPLALRVLRVAWPWLLILAWLAATTRWAAYPEISRTRVLAFALVYLAALGIAVGFRSPRTLTAILVAAFGGRCVTRDEFDLLPASQQVRSLQIDEHLYMAGAPEPEPADFL